MVVFNKGLEKIKPFETFLNHLVHKGYDESEYQVTHDILWIQSLKLTTQPIVITYSIWVQNCNHIDFKDQ